MLSGITDVNSVLLYRYEERSVNGNGAALCRLMEDQITVAACVFLYRLDACIILYDRDGSVFDEIIRLGRIGQDSVSVPLSLRIYAVL